jgi:hypothetical protein
VAAIAHCGTDILECLAGVQSPQEIHRRCNTFNTSTWIFADRHNLPESVRSDPQQPQRSVQAEHQQPEKTMSSFNEGGVGRRPRAVLIMALSRIHGSPSSRSK